MLLSAACATPPAVSDASSPTTTPPADAAEAAQKEPCMVACLRQNMARAVAAEVIEADCARSCTDPNSPEGTSPSL